MYNKVIQLYIYTYMYKYMHSFFVFSSIIGYYNVLSIVP